jgi:hypothetical protein
MHFIFELIKIERIFLPTKFKYPHMKVQDGCLNAIAYVYAIRLLMRFFSYKFRLLSLPFANKNTSFKKIISQLYACVYKWFGSKENHAFRKTPANIYTLNHNYKR